MIKGGDKQQKKRERVKSDPTRANGGGVEAALRGQLHVKRSPRKLMRPTSRIWRTEENGTKSRVDIDFSHKKYELAV